MLLGAPPHAAAPDGFAHNDIDAIAGLVRELGFNSVRLDWAYWALNGTQGPGYGRTAGAVETYGVLDPTWTMSAQAAHTAELQALIPMTLTP